MSGWIILAILLVVWMLLLYALQRRENASFSFWGPILMWKTERGKKLIGRLAEHHRLWRWYADAGIMLCLVVMVATFALILWNVYLTFQIAPENAPSPQMLIGLPGINPVIPIGYGILALAIAIVVHEFSHGILAMVGKIKVKALGLMFLIVPIGAFVEPDEDEMENVSARKRSRVFAAGPTTNLILAFLCALLFSGVFMGGLTPAVNGVMITGIASDGSFDIGDVKTWSAITALNGTAVNGTDVYDALVEHMGPQNLFTVTLYQDRETTTIEARGGLTIVNIVDNYPAEKIDLAEGDVLLSINNTILANQTIFSDILNTTRAGHTVELQYYRHQNQTWHLVNTSVLLADKYDYYQEYFPAKNKDAYKGQGFLGVSTAQLGVTTVPIDFYTKRLANPLRTRQTFFLYLALPFARLSPFPDDFTALFETPFDGEFFWPLANALYWVFWLNFALGTFNALPAIPLDGGYIFRDSMTGTIRRVRKQIDKQRAEGIAKAITTLFSVIVLLAIIAVIVVPRLRLLF